MSTFDFLFLPSFIFATTLWSALVIYVLGSRLVYDLRRRKMQSVRKILAQSRLEAVSAEERTRRVRQVLDGLPRRMIRRLATDNSTTGRMAEVFSIYAVERWGIDRVVREASSHRGLLQKWRRVAALRILSQAKYPNMLALLERALEERDRHVLGAAVDILGKMSDLRAAKLLVEALRAQRYPASRIATQLDHFPLPIREFLRPLLTDLDPVARLWGATLLSHYPPTSEIETELAALGGDPDPRVRKAAIVTLGTMAVPSAAAIATKLLYDPVWWVKAHAARTLGHLGRHDLASLVAPLLADTEWWVRTAAKESLETMGKDVWRALVPYLEHPDRFARNGVAEVLQNMGVLDSLVVEAAEGRLGREDSEILRKVLAAGGDGLVEAVAGRAEPNVAPRVRRLLEEMGLEPAGRAS